jgi:predicted small metal-binding protein
LRTPFLLYLRSDREANVKEFSCSDYHSGCNEIIRAETEAALIVKVARHLRKAHGEACMTPEAVTAVRACFHDRDLDEIVRALSPGNRRPAP